MKGETNELLKVSSWEIPFFHFQKGLARQIDK